MDDTRTLYSADMWKVTATIETDYDSTPRDFECYSTEDVLLFGDGWEFVDLHVTVELNGAVIGEDRLGGVEHGAMGDAVTADAWDLTPPEYARGDDGTPTVTMGSPLAGVVIEAIASADRWLQSIDAHPDRASFDRMLRTFDPHVSMASGR